MIIDGKAIAAEILARAKERAGHLPHAPRVVAIVANETLATRSYLTIKGKRATDAGCELVLKQFPESISTGELHLAVTNADADSVIVQLPLPAGIDTDRVCNAIPVEKDADVLSYAARELFEEGAECALLPPVVAAVAEILGRARFHIPRKKAVVIGRGRLVGAPVASWLKAQGAEVTVITEAGMPAAAPAIAEADLIVSGAGRPHLIKPDMIKEGVVLIDAGTSESAGVLAGDADPACAPKCSAFTPVPGGVGPIAVAMLFQNAVLLAERKLHG